MDRFLVRMWDSKYQKMWTFENDGFLECVFECLKQQLAYESRLEVLENISYNHIVDGRIFMQCTGKKDKNDKLIYESDIVKDINGHYGYIKWDSEELKYFVYKRLGCVPYLTPCSMVHSYEYEVVGNIHENKDLLEATND